MFLAAPKSLVMECPLQPSRVHGGVAPNEILFHSLIPRLSKQPVQRLICARTGHGRLDVHGFQHPFHIYTKAWSRCVDTFLVGTFSQRCVDVFVKGSFFDIQVGSAEIRPVWSHTKPGTITATIREATKLKVALRIAVLVWFFAHKLSADHCFSISASLGLSSTVLALTAAGCS